MRAYLGREYRIKAGKYGVLNLVNIRTGRVLFSIKETHVDIEIRPERAVRVAVDFIAIEPEDAALPTGQDEGR